MEESLYSAYKHFLSSVPAKALNCSSYLILSKHLDRRQDVMAESNIPRDYRGLGQQMDIQYEDIVRFSEFPDRTHKILDAWKTNLDSTLDKLITYLENMDQFHIIDELIPALKDNVNSYLRHEKSQDNLNPASEHFLRFVNVNPPAQACQNMQNEEKSRSVNLDPPAHGWQNMQNEETSSSVNLDPPGHACHNAHNKKIYKYDAYLCYADEDISIAKFFAECLESSPLNLKLYIRERDTPAGSLDLDTNIAVIKNSCRRMLILFTRNYVQCPEMEFQVSFAQSLSIMERKRMLIPTILEPCEIPDILAFISKINLTKECNVDWMWEKLINSLTHEDDVKEIAPSTEKNPLTDSNKITTSVGSEFLNSRSAVTSNQSPRQSLGIDNNCSVTQSMTTADTLENDVKPSVVNSNDTSVKYVKPSVLSSAGTRESNVKPEVLNSAAIKESNAKPSVLNSAGTKENNVKPLVLNFAGTNESNVKPLVLTPARSTVRDVKPPVFSPENNAVKYVNPSVFNSDHRLVKNVQPPVSEFANTSVKHAKPPLVNSADTTGNYVKQPVFIPADASEMDINPSVLKTAESRSFSKILRSSFSSVRAVFKKRKHIPNTTASTISSDVCRNLI